MLQHYHLSPSRVIEHTNEVHVGVRTAGEYKAEFPYGTKPRNDCTNSIVTGSHISVVARNYTCVVALALLGTNYSSSTICIKPLTERHI